MAHEVDNGVARKRSKWALFARRKWLAYPVGLLLTVLLLFLIVRFAAPAGGPTSTFVKVMGARERVEGQNWDIHNLVKYMENRLGKPIDYGEMSQEGSGTWWILTKESGHVVYLIQEKTSESAAELAGRNVPGNISTCWGRWVFWSGDEKELDLYLSAFRKK
jgi:hypothetical protein